MKQLLTILFLLFPFIGMNAGVIPVGMQPKDNVDIFNPIKRTPAKVPEIGIDGITLVRLQAAADVTYNVEILQNDEVLYIESWNFLNEELSLPSYLKGDFEIRLSSGTKTFVGYINID